MKIAIVNDCLVATEAIRRALLGSGRHTIAWTAGNGMEAVESCLRDRPELVLMDLIMPGMDGIEATRRIMREAPCAILVVTAVMETQSGKVFEAMGAGALDAVQVPEMGANGTANGVAGFLQKIDAVGRLMGESAMKSTSSLLFPKRADCLVAIGCSAGGPAALTVVLRALPADLRAAVVIVQHVDAHFAPGLAKWLNESSSLPVRPAVAGDTPVNGEILLASSNDHLVFESSRRLAYTPDPVDYSYRPSVNAFFESTARHWRGPVIGVILTGMGGDGATGLKALRSLGHHTIAQDRASSAVYGMPRAAFEIGAAVEVVPLDSVALAICRRLPRASQEAAPLQSL